MERLKKGEHVNSINVETKEVSNQTASEEKEYKKTDLNRSVVVRDQIRKVLQEYKDSVYTKMYPDREPNFDYLPKTLIFAESDIHASLIVEVAKEVFGREEIDSSRKSRTPSTTVLKEFNRLNEMLISELP